MSLRHLESLSLVARYLSCLPPFNLCLFAYPLASGVAVPAGNVHHTGLPVTINLYAAADTLAYVLSLHSLFTLRASKRSGSDYACFTLPHKIVTVSGAYQSMRNFMQDSVANFRLIIDLSAGLAHRDSAVVESAPACSSLRAVPLEAPALLKQAVLFHRFED
jgi:hypothetical protein